MYQPEGSLSTTIPISPELSEKDKKKRHSLTLNKIRAGIETKVEKAAEITKDKKQARKKGLPKEFYISDMTREQKEKQRKSGELKIERLGGKTTHVCKVHGEMHITNFFIRLHKPTGKWYVCNCGLCRKGRKQTAPRKTQPTKEQLKKYAKRRVDKLSDSYIKSLLKATGFRVNKMSPKTLRDAIAKKRKEVLEKRARIESYKIDPAERYRFKGKNERDRLNNSYITRILKNTPDYNGGQITIEMIEKKRAEIKLMRQAPELDRRYGNTKAGAKRKDIKK